MTASTADLKQVIQDHMLPLVQDALGQRSVRFSGLLPDPASTKRFGRFIADYCATCARCGRHTDGITGAFVILDQDLAQMKTAMDVAEYLAVKTKMAARSMRAWIESYERNGTCLTCVDGLEDLLTCLDSASPAQP